MVTFERKKREKDRGIERVAEGQREREGERGPGRERERANTTTTTTSPTPVPNYTTQLPTTHRQPAHSCSRHVLSVTFS